MSAATAIDRRARPLTITRGAPGSYVDGIWVPGAETAITIRADTQPLSGKERQNLPEGIREAGQWRVWSRSEMKIGDKLTIDGTACLIIDVEKWPSYYRAIAGDSDAST